MTLLYVRFRACSLLLRIILAINLMAIAACTPRDTRIPLNAASLLRAETNHFNGEGIVVIGIKIKGEESTRYGIHSVKDGVVEADGANAWAGYAGCITKYREHCKYYVNDTSYLILRMPPGVFAVSWIGGEKGTYLFIDAQGVRETRRRYVQTNSGATMGNSHAKLDIIEGRVTRDSPTFSLAPGEVVYVGNVEFDETIQPNGATTLSVREEDARKVLTQFGIDSPMTIRPWTRANGPGSRPGVKRGPSIARDQ